MKSIFCILAFALVLVSCSHTGEAETEPTSVKVLRVDTLPTQFGRSYSFISQPYRSTDLSFRVGGPVNEFSVQSGQFFHKGEIIASIDSRDFLLNKQRTEALYKQAKSDYERISNLYSKDNISGTAYEQAKANYERTQADYMNAVNALSDTKLIAPFDGYVQQVHIERYQDVRPSVPVVTFIDLSKIKVEVYVPEDMAVCLSQGKPDWCKIDFQALPGHSFVPSDTYLTQSTTDNNISYLFTALIDNVDNSLLGGMAGTLSLKTGVSSASSNIAIPLTAVCHAPNEGSYVWKVDPRNQVVKTPVVTGQLLNGNRIEIVKGLCPGDDIALTRITSLSENETITKQNE